MKLIEEEIKMSTNFKGVDIFLSSEWPEGFEKYTSFKDQVTKKSLWVTRMAAQLSPRYHFCALEDKYLARFPYQNEQGHLSRLVCLGQWQSSQKHLSAFQIVPLNIIPQEELRQITEDATANPYSQMLASLKQKSKISSLSIQQQIEQDLIEEEEEKIQQKEKEQANELIKPLQSQTKQAKANVKLTENIQLHFSGFDYRTNDDDIIEFLSRWGQITKINIVYDDKSKKHKGYGFIEYKDLKVTQQVLDDSEQYSLHGRHIKFNPANQSQKDNHGKQNDKCWFCYSNPSIDKSLIFYEGKHCYLALDKGPLSRNHFMIVPYDHVSCSIDFSEELREEVSKLKKNLLEIFGKGLNQGIIIFERHVKLAPNINHAIINCVPLDSQKISAFQSKFETVVKHHQIQFFKLEHNELISSCVGDNEFFFNIDIHISQSEFKRYLYVFKETERFPLDFGRQIICEILQIPQRLHWKDCQLSSKEQKESIEEMKFNSLKFK